MSLIGVIGSAARRRVSSVSIPTDISGCAVWLDFSDSATIFDATTGGSTPVDNGNIRRIEDKSGNGRHFVEGASGNAPIRTVAQINGLDAAYFTTDYMKREATLSTSGGAALFIVLQRTVDGAGGMHCIRGQVVNLHHPYFGSYYDSFAVTARQNWTQAFSTSTQLYVVTWDGAGTWTARINGSTVKTSTGLTGADAISPMQIGAGVPGNYYGDGYYCEAAIYTASLSTGDRDALETALMTKWGI